MSLEEICITVPQVLQPKSVIIDIVLVQPWTASIKDSSIEACSQCTETVRTNPLRIQHKAMAATPDLHVLATHVPIEDVENLISKQGMPQLVRDNQKNK